MANKIFIIGASGKIGSALYEEATTVANTVGTATESKGPLIGFSLDKWDDFDFSLIKPGDIIYLAAAISSPDICSEEYHRAYAANVTSTVSFIQRVMQHEARVVFFSSDTVYGEKREIIDETGSIDPAGDYAMMKRRVEQEFEGSELFKAVRLSFVFFKNDSFTRYLRHCAARGEEAELYDPFERAVISRLDVTAGLLALAHKWHEIKSGVVNFGGPEVLSRAAFADSLIDTMLPGLRYRVTHPSADFFSNRPRRIAMQSPWLPQLLGRSPLTIREAAPAESGAI
jgi:dTDP-4-dehydrorhamnose reductase